MVYVRLRCLQPERVFIRGWTTETFVNVAKTTSGQPMSVKTDSYFSSNLDSPLMSDACACGIAQVNVPPLQPPCLRHNSSIKGRIALENRWDLMIAPRPGLIDWMISSLSRLVALPAAQPPSHSSSSPLPVTLTLPPIISQTPKPFNSVTLYAPIPKSFPILYFPLSLGATVPCYASPTVIASKSSGFSSPQVLMVP